MAEVICGGEFGAGRQIHPHIDYPPRQFPENLFIVVWTPWTFACHYFTSRGGHSLWADKNRDLMAFLGFSNASQAEVAALMAKFAENCDHYVL